MNKRFRAFVLLFGIIVLLPVVVQAIQIQRSQIGVTIIVNVTPNPLAFVQPGAASGPIVARTSLRGAPRAVQQIFRAQELHFTALGNTVAQTVQKGVKVEASIAPNPTATLLYSDQTAVTVNAEAGVTAVIPCVYHVTVDTAVTSWSLKHGLGADFSGNPGTFSGTDLGNNSYVSTPRPTATPFSVYADNGGVWQVLDTNAGMKTYCVDLTFNIPIATSQGTYSSNAIYTLYY